MIDSSELLSDYGQTRLADYGLYISYHLNVRLTLTSSHIGGHNKLGKRQAADHMMLRDRWGSTSAHRSFDAQADTMHWPLDCWCWLLHNAIAFKPTAVYAIRYYCSLLTATDRV